MLWLCCAQNSISWITAIHYKLIVLTKLSGYVCMEEISVRVGRRIRRIRLAKRRTLKELAASIGMDHNYLSRIELGKVNTSLENFDSIARGLHVSLPVLLDVDNALSRKQLLKTLRQKASTLSDESLLLLVSLANELTQHPAQR